MASRTRNTADYTVGEETRVRLVTMAERLFSERGIDAVSVRDITSAAGANTASIHYHFGSKRDLIVAILERRAEDLGGLRARYLDRLEGRSNPNLRAVVEAMVLPSIDLANDESRGGQNYVGFLAALATHPELSPLMAEAYDPYTQRYLALLERVTPKLSADARYFRFAVAKEMIYRVVGQPNGPVHQWIENHRPGADAKLTKRLVEFVVGAFREPGN